MPSAHIERKPVVAERFIRKQNLKKTKFVNILLQYQKNVYVDNLDDIVNKCNNTYHSTIKMKPVDVKSSTYIDFGRKNKDNDPNFKVGDHLRVSKYKNIFGKGYVPN